MRISDTNPYLARLEAAPFQSKSDGTTEVVPFPTSPV
jgi:hypothetical protein